MTKLAYDPPVSEKQRRAMYAAAEGKSNLGIPTSVGKEFVGKDEGFEESKHPRAENGQFGSGGSPKKSKLSSSEKSTISSYSGDAFFKLNAELRKGDTSDPQIQRLDSAISKSKIPSGTTLYRGMTKEAAKKLFKNGQINKGQVISDPAFSSTSTKQSIGKIYGGGGGVMLKIDVTRDSSGLDMSSHSSNSSENEVLLPRNAKMKVTGITPGKTIMDPVVVHVTYGDDENLAKDAAEIKGAGIMFVAPDESVLFILRSPDSNNPNMWDLPGGQSEDGESPEDTARREAMEEIGAMPYGELSLITDIDGDFVTYRQFIRHKFVPKLNDAEHVAYKWATLDDLPSPLHPGVQKVVESVLGASIAQDADFKEDDHPRAENGQFGSGGSQGESPNKSSNSHKISSGDYGAKEPLHVTISGTHAMVLTSNRQSNLILEKIGEWKGSKTGIKVDLEKNGQALNDLIEQRKKEKAVHYPSQEELWEKMKKEESLKAQENIESPFKKESEQKEPENKQPSETKNKVDDFIESYGREEVKEDLIDIFSGNKSLAEKVLNGEKELNETQLNELIRYLKPRKQAHDHHTLAFDRASLRVIDQDGRMRVEISHISKAMVCPYLGHEIPDYESLGLDADTVYHLLRDPEELKKSVDTWNAVPLLNDHIAVSAEDHQPQAVVGATGTDAAFNEPYLDNSLVIWEAKAIKGIESGRQQEISCAYYYTPDMTPGKYEGVAYDGVMRNIRANHVALVEKGRAGPDVLVNDSLNFGVINMGKSLSKKAVMAKGALLAVLKPQMMAADSQINLDSILSGVKRRNWLDKKPGIIAAIKPQLAKDADLETLIELLDRLDGEIPAEDDDDDAMMGEDDDDAKCEAVMQKLRGKISDADLEEIRAMLSAPKAMDEEEDDKEKKVIEAEKIKKEEEKEKTAEDDSDKDKEKDMMNKAAMDKAIKLACDATAREIEKKTIARLNAVRDAEDAVKPYVGKLVAMDSADEVYKAALHALKVDIAGVHPSAYRHILLAQPNPNEAKKAARPLASDSSLSSDIMDQFPDLKR